MKNIALKIIATGAYIAMVAVNYMANSLPLNNRSTGEISDAYPNLFAPAGLTFSIWGLIYLLLGIYIIYQFKNNKKNESLIKKINVLFILTSLANIFWVFAWHFDYISLSLIIIISLLVLLIKIANIIRVEHFTKLEKFIIATPFSIYFGWITVATIANASVFLVSIGWKGFGIADYIWTSIILVVGAYIGLVRMVYDKNAAYGLVFVWAYLGILIKHLSVDGFNGQYPLVITTIILCLAMFMVFLKKLLFRK